MEILKPRENPLVPHAVLRRLYETMLVLRKGDNAAARRRGERSARGEEAMRASALLSLQPGDLISDVGKVPEIHGGPSVLAPLGSGAIRVLSALGAASALRAQGAKRLAVVYVAAGELQPAEWKRLLGLAGGAELPVIFAVLPGGAERRHGVLSDRAQGWGVPGMPVDAADAVALYRVMQESVLRARGGDGPALLECVRWRVAGESGAAADGIEAMRKTLQELGLFSGKTKRTF